MGLGLGFFLNFKFLFLSQICWGFFSVLLLVFLDLLILFLGMQNFWDLLDFCTDWFVKSWHPFGCQENCQENAVIAKKITCIFCYL